MRVARGLLSAAARSRDRLVPPAPARGTLGRAMSSSSSADATAASAPEKSRIVSQDPESDKPLIVIVGATGVGKTKLSVDLATRVNGEIINADAVQMYRGLDIAAAKATSEETKGIPHHAMSFLNHDEKYTVKAYRDHALALIKGIHSRGKVPILVGGTLYYIQNVVWPTLIDAGGDGDDDEREIADRDEVAIPEGLTPHEYLKELDPVQADALHPRDLRKIQRSIYVCKTTGRPHSKIIEELRASGVQDKLRFRTSILWLRCDEKAHVARIGRRVDKMMAAGLVEEATAFIKKHDLDKLAPKDPSLQLGQLQAIGFREFLPYVRAMEDPKVNSKSLEYIKRECLNLVSLHHEQYRKYQIKWIRKRLLSRNAPVYALDTDRCESIPSAWESDVLAPAVHVVKWLQSDNSLATTDPAGLERQNVERRKDSRLKTFHCEICGITSIGKEQHEKHLRGNRHRRAAGTYAPPVYTKKRRRDTRFSELLEAEMAREDNK